MQERNQLRLIIILALLGILFTGCEREETEGYELDSCFCMFPLPWHYSATPIRKGLLSYLGFECADTLSRDSVLNVSRVGLCDVYHQRKSVYHHRPVDLLRNDGAEDASNYDKYDAIWNWGFPKVQHWEFSGAKPLRFEDMKGGWVLRFFSQCRLGENRSVTPFVVLTIRGRDTVISYRITKLRIGGSVDAPIKIIDGFTSDPRSPDSVLYEDSGTAVVRDIQAEYMKLSNLPEFDVPVLSLGMESRFGGCRLNGRNYLGNGVLIELMTDSGWQMTKGLVRSIGDYWPPLKRLLRERFPNSAISHDSDLWYRPPVPMTSYNLRDSSVTYKLECDYDTWQIYYDPHPKRIITCEAFGWGDYCGEPWVPK